MASINVKVIIKNQTKTFRFSNELYIGEAIKEILVKLNETSSALDHGLFQPATDEIKARWLKNNRTFKYYGIASGVCISTLYLFKSIHLTIIYLAYCRLN